MSYQFCQFITVIKVDFPMTSELETGMNRSTNKTLIDELSTEGFGWWIMTEILKTRYGNSIRPSDN